jgi:hypothetical protein
MFALRVSLLRKHPVLRTDHHAVTPLSSIAGLNAVSTNYNSTERKRKIEGIKIALRMFRGSSKYRLCV